MQSLQNNTNDPNRSRTWLRHNYIEYLEMPFIPIFPRFRRHVPEEDLSIQEDACRWDNQSIRQLNPLLPDALDLNGWRRSPSKDVLQSGWVPQCSAGVELPGDRTLESVSE